MLFLSRRECVALQIEKVTLQFETISERLVWALCISNSGAWTLSVREIPLYILADTLWEENYASCICRYCDYMR